MEERIGRISKGSAMKNAIWKMVESFAAKGVSMIITLVLARLLDAEAYGIVGLTGIFLQLSDILVQAGFSTALIRKPQVTDKDYSTVFFISLGTAKVMYAAIFVGAPIIASFYETPELIAVLRVLGLGLFMGATGAVRGAVIARAMKFRITTIINLISSLSSGVLGIVLAATGFGVWALVAQSMFGSFLSMVLLFIVVKIRIKPIFSMESLRDLLPPSLKILASSLLSFTGDSVYGAAIGKVYSVEQLGLYSKGEQLPRQFSLYTFGAISSVFLPVFASYQEDYERLNQVFRRVVNLCLFILMPLMVGLCATGDQVITLLLTEKWVSATPILRWACLYYLATPMLLANVQMHLAIGRAGTRAKVEMRRLILLLVSFVVLMLVKAPVEMIMATRAGIEVVIAILIFLETRKAIGFHIRWVLSDVLPTVVATGLMCASVVVCRLWLPSLVSLPNILLLGVEVLLAVIVYVVVSLVLKNKAFYEALSMVKSLKK
jgi:O-antigen/teichoic acid export membrane protein